MSARKAKSGSGHRPIVIERHTGTYGALGYRSARVARSEGRSYFSYPGSAHDERDRANLIAQSRDFMRSNAIYKGMIDRMVSYIVANGFELQVTGPAAGTIKKIEKLWRDWLRRPGVRGVLSGSKVARMVMRELLVAGDTAILKTKKKLIQHFEAEQIAGDKRWYPNGIKKDQYGKPVNFQLCPWKSNSVDIKKGTKVAAENVLFLTNPERPSSLRGVPACQSAFPMLHRINDVCDSEAIAWQLLSRIAVSFEREGGPLVGHTESREDPNKSADELEGDLATRLTEMAYALIFHAEPGEKVTGIERNIPGKDFSASLRMFLRLLGLPLGCPLELVLLDWTKSNYSQSRAVLEQAFQNFIEWQGMLTDFFYEPLFQWRFADWQAAGLIGKNVKVTISLITPTFPWIDQLKEAQAYGAKVDRGFTTHGQVCKSLNTDRTEIVDQREKEVRDAIERVKKIKAETEVDVPWQIFAGMEPPKAAAPKDKAEPDEDQEKDDA
jgi:capsid protein